MQLGIKTEGVDFVVSRTTQRKNDNGGRQKTDQEVGEPLHVSELVAMDNTGAEVIKVTTAGQPKITKRQLVTVVKLVATRGTSTVAAGWPSAPTRSPRPHRRTACTPGGFGEASTALGVPDERPDAH